MTQRYRSKTELDASQDRKNGRDKRRGNRRELGQTFLKYERTARRIVAASGVGAEDLVVEFGAGGGILTRELARVAGRVVAVELDPFWAARLEERFYRDGNVRVLPGDALRVPLPDEPFVVVTNVPFCATTPILHCLLDDPYSSPLSAHLVVQKQVALKHASPSPTTLKTLTWSPWYEFTTCLRLSANAFRPRPKVDACLMVAARRDPPLVEARHRHFYRALVRRAFEGSGNRVGRTLRPYFSRTQLRRLAGNNEFSLYSPPSALTVHQWSEVFRFIVSAIPRERWPRPNVSQGRGGS